MSLKLFSTFLLSGISLTSCNVKIIETVKIETNSTPDVNANNEPKGISQEVILSNRGIIWGITFLPNSDIIFTEKSGKISIFSNNTVSEIIGLPNDIDASGQGGMLDVCVHPDYKTNGWIYACYSSKVSGFGKLNLIRFKLDQTNAAKELSVIFSSSATNKWLGHYGSRIVFDKNKKLFLSIGEGGQSSYGGESSPNQNAQNLKEAWGKIHRLNDDGGIPTDNPKFGNGTVSSIYSYGHRNPQGLVYDSVKDELWETEHGPKGGDEFNKVIKANNYGWPLVSYGVNYDGKVISENPLKTGVTPATHFWTPSIGACGLAIINSDKYGTWKGQFLAGGLALQYLSKLKIDSDAKLTESKLLNSVGRIRDVKQSPDGFIYISVENPGRIIKLVPNF